MSSLLKTVDLQQKQQFANPIQKEKSKQKGRKQKQTVTVFPQETKPKLTAKKRKHKIPAALREQVWIHKMGRVFQGKCPVTWCQNTITVFDFQSGHNIPESKGGATNLENLVPLCSRCNLSMGDTYTIDEWSKISGDAKTVKTVDVVEPPKRSCLFPWC